MNKLNLQKAINVMQRVKQRNDNFDMEHWQSQDPENETEPVIPVRTEEELRGCGMSACFGGWLSVSPEWREDGGSIDNFATPIFKDAEGSYAIAEWLEIDFHEACKLTHPQCFREANGLGEEEPITVDHVIRALHNLMENEE